MDERIFLQRFAETLGVDPATLTRGSRLGDAWDSVAVVSTIALIDELSGATVSGDALAACRTVADVLRLATGS